MKAKQKKKTTTPDSICYIDGEFKSLSEAKISATDLAIMRGYGIFDSLRTYGGKPFRLEDHLVRLERSAELVDLPLPHSRDKLRQIIQDTLNKNTFKESGIRIIVTGGDTDEFFTPSGKPSLLVIVMPLPHYPESNYSDGVKISTAKMERFIPEAKTTNYTFGEVAMKKAKSIDPDVFEVLCVDRQNRVTECIASNVFAFFGNTLTTPGSDILYGITRQVVLELADPLSPIEIRDIYVDEIKEADEIFITGSSKEIVPVRAVDDVIIGNGACGPETKKLMDAFRKMRDAMIQNPDSN